MGLKIALGLGLLGIYVASLDPAVRKVTLLFIEHAGLWLRHIAATGN
jgi:hypothetical protein